MTARVVVKFDGRGAESWAPFASREALIEFLVASSVEVGKGWSARTHSAVVPNDAAKVPAEAAWCRESIGKNIPVISAATVAAPEFVASLSLPNGGATLVAQFGDTLGLPPKRPSVSGQKRKAPEGEEGSAAAAAAAAAAGDESALFGGDGAGAPSDAVSNGLAAQASTIGDGLPLVAAAAAAAAASAPAEKEKKDKGSGLLAATHYNEWAAYAGGEKPLPRAPAEKRVKKWRTQAPKDVADRVLKAQTERMYLLERKPLGNGSNAVQYTVLGSNGVIFDVVIGSPCSCTCPEATKQDSSGCKHIVYVLQKFVRVPSTNPLVWQASFLANELEYMFAHAPDPGKTAALAAEHVRKAYFAATNGGATLLGPAASGDGSGLSSAAAAVASAAGIATMAAAVADQRPLEHGAECPVCFDLLEPPGEGLELEYCSIVAGGCGNSFHRNCMQLWRAAKQAKGEPVSCPYCKQAAPPAQGQMTLPSSTSAGGPLDIGGSTSDHHQQQHQLQLPLQNPYGLQPNAMSSFMSMLGGPTSTSMGHMLPFSMPPMPMLGGGAGAGNGHFSSSALQMPAPLYPPMTGHAGSGHPSSAMMMMGMDGGMPMSMSASSSGGSSDSSTASSGPLTLPPSSDSSLGPMMMMMPTAPGSSSSSSSSFSAAVPSGSSAHAMPPPSSSSSTNSQGSVQMSMMTMMSAHGPSTIGSGSGSSGSSFDGAGYLSFGGGAGGVPGGIGAFPDPSGAAFQGYNL